MTLDVPTAALIDPLRVTLHADPPSDWDSYVAGHPEGTSCHRAAAVQVGRHSFGLDTRFVVAREGNRMIGALPLVEQSSFLFGRFLVSVPFFTYGGILADNPAVTRALAEQARLHGVERKVDHTELRHNAAVPALDLPVRTDKVSMVLELPRTEEELSRQLGSKLRSQIKRAQREQPEIVWGHRDLLAEFYRVFSVSMRDLGTPVYPRRFFEVACDAFGELLSVIVIRVQGRPQATAVLLRHGSTIEVPWAAADPAAKRNSVNMRMYWELLAHAVRAGARVFDFGRSTAGSGTYRFKEQWGAKPRQLYWHYLLPPGRNIPLLNNTNPRYALATALWKRMPVRCANTLGPWLARGLP